MFATVYPRRDTHPVTIRNRSRIPRKRGMRSLLARTPPFSLRLVPGPGFPFDPAFFRPGRVCPPDPCAVALVPAAALRSLPRVARVARAGAERRARQLPEPLSRPCTTQWCDKLSLPAPENLQQEPAQIP